MLGGGRREVPPADRPPPLVVGLSRPVGLILTVALSRSTALILAADQILAADLIRMRRRSPRPARHAPEVDPHDPPR